MTLERVSGVVGVLVWLCLACSASPSSSPRPEAPIATAHTPDSSERPEPEPETGGRAQPASIGRTLEIDGRALRLDGALVVPKPEDARAGFDGLNALFRELSSGAAGGRSCDQTSLAVGIAPSDRTSDVLGPLGIAAEAGCESVVLRVGSEELRVRLEGAVAAAACDPEKCLQLTLPETSHVVDWLPDARQVRDRLGPGGEVPLRLDRSPRPVVATPPTGAMTPTGRLEPTIVAARVYAEYTLVHRCLLASTGKTVEAPAGLHVELEVGVDGVPRNVQVAPGSEKVSESLASCLVTAFGRMTFPAPNHGPARITYPIARE
jgi:hypothetical protein